MSAYSQSYKEVGVAGMVCKIEAGVKVTVVRKYSFVLIPYTNVCF